MSLSTRKMHMSTVSLVDDTVTWEEIQQDLNSLKVDFEPMPNARARLEYPDFERIFHSLFMIIDAQESRRKFRPPIYPALDAGQRDKFVENAIAFINEKRFNQQHLTKSHLRTFGGKTFKELLATLIKRAKEIEEKQNEKIRRLEDMFPLLPGLNLDPNQASPKKETRHDNSEPSINLLQEILQQNPNTRYDDAEILEYSKKYLCL